MCREDCASCNAISVACQLRKKAAAAEIGRLGVWTNHVKISVVASENALQPNEPIASRPHAFGLGNGLGAVCAVVSGLSKHLHYQLKPRATSRWAVGVAGVGAGREGRRAGGQRYAGAVEACPCAIPSGVVTEVLTWRSRCR